MTEFHFPGELALLRKYVTLKCTFVVYRLSFKTLIFQQDHNLDWFPRMRAMSLVSSDAEGEQNEIRSLQEKLESTMKLVSNLSGQLTELKEQVSDKVFGLISAHPVQGDATPRSSRPDEDEAQA